MLTSSDSRNGTEQAAQGHPALRDLNPGHSIFPPGKRLPQHFREREREGGRNGGRKEERAGKRGAMCVACEKLVLLI